jgi:hypothetical protein
VLASDWSIKIVASCDITHNHRACGPRCSALAPAPAAPAAAPLLPLLPPPLPQPSLPPQRSPSPAQVGFDDNDNIPAGPASPGTIVPALPTGQQVFRDTQIADQPRPPWAWQNGNTPASPTLVYVPAIAGKW